MIFHIVQLDTFEEVLSSVCYFPYWLHSALIRQGQSVVIHEDVTVRSFDRLIASAAVPGDRVILDVSTAPQIELALAIWRKHRWVLDIKCIGYEPFIRGAGLPYFDPDAERVNLLDGAFSFPYFWDQYEYGYSTIDSHIVYPGQRKPFVPMFFSVGCKRHCEYCYVTGTNYPYGVLDLDRCYRLIDYAYERRWNIHIEDENFYRHSYARQIIERLGERGIKWIALTDSVTLSKVLREWGEEFLTENGHWLSEVGLESINESLIRKRQNIERLLDSNLQIFWLSITFFPRETIATLNRSGEFYREHGIPWNMLLPRLKTQSSMALGQFFQPYPGTRLWKDLIKHGVMLTDTPTRLTPSYVGHSFLKDVPVVKRCVEEDDLKWLQLYMPENEMINELMSRSTGKHAMSELTGHDQERLAVMAQLCKLGIIGSATEE